MPEPARHRASQQTHGGRAAIPAPEAAPTPRGRGGAASVSAPCDYPLRNGPDHRTAEADTSNVPSVADLENTAHVASNRSNADVVPIDGPRATPPPQLPPPSPRGSRVALGVVTMTKRPLNMATWLHYHHTRVGIRRFFIKVEDTPELKTLFAMPPWDRLVIATFSDGTHRDYFKQMDRQTAHVAASLPLARAIGLTHLLHIDGA